MKQHNTLVALAACPKTEFRLLGALTQQKRFPVPADFVVVAPQPLGATEGFEVLQVVDPKIITEDGHYNLSRARNLSCAYASQAGYDFLIVGDADSVFTKIPHNEEMRKVRLAQSMVSFMGKGEGNVAEFRPTCARHVSWFVMHHSVFSRSNLWDEGFSGWGYEDIAFYARQWYGMNYRTTGCGVEAVHLWHEIPTSRGPETEKNRQRCKEYIDWMIDKYGPFDRVAYKELFGEEHK